MKRVIGYFTVLAAIALIGTSAFALFVSAYESAVVPWQQWLKGAQIVAIIIWEAGAIIAIGYCMSHRYFVIGIGGTALLLAAMSVTMSAEMRLQAGSQENAVVRRTAEAGRYELIKQELEKAIKHRDELRAKRRLSDFDQDELLRTEGQIDKLKAGWSPLVETSAATSIPGAAIIHRWTGLNLADSGDIDVLSNVLLWTLARVFALPLAVFGLALLSASEKPQEARSPKVDNSAEKVGTPVVALPVPSELMVLASSEKAPQRRLGVMSYLEGQPDTSPDPDGDQPKPEPLPEEPKSETVVASADPKVVNTDGTPWLPAKEAKQSRQEALRETAVKRFFSEIYQEAPIDKTEKGGWKSGGTRASVVRKDYEQFCIENKFPILKGSHFGRYACAEFDSAPSHAGRYYACIRKQVASKAQPKRRAA